MEPLLAIGFGLVMVAVVLPRKSIPLIVAGSLVCAAGARLGTDELFLVAGAGLVPMLSGLVLREIVLTFRMVAEPRRAQRQAENRRRRATERSRERERRQRLAA